MRKDVGAVDVKVNLIYQVTNLEMFEKESCLAISGPSHQEQPAFNFDKSIESHPVGLPKVWNFDWIEITPEFIKNRA